jgi:hypothetical protein
VAVSQVMVSLRTLSAPPDTSPGLPGSSTDLSARALLPHPGRPDQCFCSLLPGRWQASPSLAGWPPPCKCNEADSGSLNVRAHAFVVRGSHPPSLPPYTGGNRPTPRFRLPQAGGRNSLLNEQLTSMTPFSHIDQPGLSWRTRDRRGYFFWLPLRGTAAKNRLRPSAVRSFPRSGRLLFHCRPLTGNEKIGILCVLCALSERWSLSVFPDFEFPIWLQLRSAECVCG